MYSLYTSIWIISHFILLTRWRLTGKCYGFCADGGFFLYAEGYNRSALLLAPELSLAGPPAPRCLSFWYYAFGSMTASTVLRVYIGREQVYSRPEWSRRKLKVGTWTKGTVHVSPRTAPVQIVFAVEFGEAFGGLALDDISVIEGHCDSCMFTSLDIASFCSSAVFRNCFLI